jgi:G3E family GTPase
MTHPPQPTPLTILTGFLGAGKTTLLNRLITADHGLKVAVMVNDFGAINIDSQMIVSVEGSTVSLSNGCICCTINEDFLKETLALLDRPDPPEYIIVETSGVSDPIDVALTFKAIPRVRIDSILTVIDTEQILDLSKENEILALNQIGTADIVLLNKVDLVDDQQRQKVRQFVTKIAPRARILETAYANAPLEVLLDVGLYSGLNPSVHQPQDVHVHEVGTHHHDHPHHDHSLIFDTWSWTSYEPLNARAVQQMVDQLPNSIYRAKGFLYLIESPYRAGVLQVVGKRANLTYLGQMWEDQTPYSQLVFIGAHGSINPDDMQRRLEACLAKNAPKSDLSRIADLALSWLRRKSERTK